MRKQAGLLEHQLAHGREVFERAIEAQRFQKLSCFREHSLGLIAQAEQSFFASGTAARFGHRQHFIRRSCKAARRAAGQRGTCNSRNNRGKGA